MTPEGARLTEAHRKQQARLNVLTTAQLLRIWPLLDPTALDATAAAWLTAAAALVGDARRRSVDMAMAYLPAFRALEIGEGIVPTPAPTLDAERLRTSMLITGPVRIKKAMTAGTNLATAVEKARISAARAGARQALNGGRETITLTSEADPKAMGYERVTSGNPCDYCAGTAGTGPYFENVTFPAHDGCSCSSAPFYQRAEPRPKPQPRSKSDAPKTPQSERPQAPERLLTPGDLTPSEGQTIGNLGVRRSAGTISPQDYRRQTDAILAGAAKRSGLRLPKR